MADKKEMTRTEIEKHNADIMTKIKDMNEKHQDAVSKLKDKIIDLPVNQATLAECNAMANKKFDKKEDAKVKSKES